MNPHNGRVVVVMVVVVPPPITAISVSVALYVVIRYADLILLWSVCQLCCTYLLLGPYKLVIGKLILRFVVKLELKLHSVK